VRSIACGWTSFRANLGRILCRTSFRANLGRILGILNTEALNVLGCLSDCDALIAELAICVSDCQNTAIGEVTGGGELSEDCLGCYGATVACSAGNCAFSGCADPSSEACINCQCEFNCTQDFDACSGLPGTGECG